MNREIKFRAYIGNKFIYSNDLQGFAEIKQFTNEGLRMIVNRPKLSSDCIEGGNNVSNHGQYYSEWYDLQQYTGRKDKNGKEIYEGDICRKLNTDWPSKPDSDPRTIQDYMNDIASVGVVVFEDCEFQLSVKSKKHYGECFNQSLRPGSHGFIEVIGNIYENPDLLK